MNHEKSDSTSQSLNVDHYLRSLYSQRDYQQTLANGNFSRASDAERLQLRHMALGRAANVLIQQQTHNQYVTPEGSVYKLLSQLGSFYHSQQELDRMKESKHPANREALRAHKERVINFNHSLRDVIDKHPHLTTSKLVNFMAASFERLYGPENVNNFVYAARTRTIGMQHEVIADQLIGAIDDDNLSYEESDLEGEMKGADFYVTLYDFTFPVDIKAAPTAFERSVEKSGRTSQLWSVVPQEVIGERFRLTPQEVEEYTPTMHEELYALAHRLQDHPKNYSVS